MKNMGIAPVRRFSSPARLHSLGRLPHRAARPPLLSPFSLSPPNTLPPPPVPFLCQNARAQLTPPHPLPPRVVAQKTRQPMRLQR